MSTALAKGHPGKEMGWCGSWVGGMLSMLSEALTVTPLVACPTQLTWSDRGKNVS